MNDDNWKVTKQPAKDDQIKDTNFFNFSRFLQSNN